MKENIDNIENVINSNINRSKMRVEVYFRVSTINSIENMLNNIRNFIISDAHFVSAPKTSVKNSAIANCRFLKFALSKIYFENYSGTFMLLYLYDRIVRSIFALDKINPNFIQNNWGFCLKKDFFLVNTSTIKPNIIASRTENYLSEFENLFQEDFKIRGMTHIILEFINENFTLFSANNEFLEYSCKYIYKFLESTLGKYHNMNSNMISQAVSITEFLISCQSEFSSSVHKTIFALLQEIYSKSKSLFDKIIFKNQELYLKLRSGVIISYSAAKISVDFELLLSIVENVSLDRYEEAMNNHESSNTISEENLLAIIGFKRSIENLAMDLVKDINCNQDHEFTDNNMFLRFLYARISIMNEIN